MCLECEKKIFVKCIENVQIEGLEAFTKEKIYGVFSWYSDNDNYVLTAIDNNEMEQNLSDGIEDNMMEFLKEEWFTSHFKVISN